MLVSPEFGAAKIAALGEADELHPYRTGSRPGEADRRARLVKLTKLGIRDRTSQMCDDFKVREIRSDREVPGVLQSVPEGRSTARS